MRINTFEFLCGPLTPDEAQTNGTMEPFSDRNLFNDAKLAELVDQVRDAVKGLSTGKLRQDANLRKYIADEMNQLRVAIDGALEDLPRRKIRLAA
jgi:hypothetical protein